MGRRDEYLNYRSGSRRRRNGSGGNPIAALVAVVLVAAACGFTAYHLAKGNLGERLSGNQLTNFLQGGATPTVAAVVTQEPENTPVPTAAPTVTPTPRGEPQMYEPYYLTDFEDTRERVDVRGIYGGNLLDKYVKNAKLAHYLDLADNTELNAIVIDVKLEDGTIVYDMQVDSVIEAGTGNKDYSQDDMKALLDELHSHGIYCIARIVCFRDEKLYQKHEDWFLHKLDDTIYIDGDKNKWINPYKELATRYIVDVACQAARDGFDEICFDYIRITSYTSGRTNTNFGRLIDYYTIQEQIVEFCKYACNRLKPMGVFVSASVYGGIINSAVDAKNVGQNYTEMAKYMDYMCPMVYPSHYANGYAGFDIPDFEPYKLVSFELQSSAKKLEAASEEAGGITLAKCRPWLQSFSASWLEKYKTYTNPVIREQVKACYDNNINEWMYWNAAGNYDEEAFEKK